MFELSVLESWGTPRQDSSWSQCEVPPQTRLILKPVRPSAAPAREPDRRAPPPSARAQRLARPRAGRPTTGDDDDDDDDGNDDADDADVLHDDGDDDEVACCGC